MSKMEKRVCICLGMCFHKYFEEAVMFQRLKIPLFFRKIPPELSLGITGVFPAQL
jgi:hypothetical protein